MDLEVVGRHVLLFDDDSNASFVNSAAALVDWNSLSIDRYDVRHLLSTPPPRVKRRFVSPAHHPDSPSESELDHERYLDLPSTSPEHEQDIENGAGPVNDGGFHAVPFSYGNTDESTKERNVDSESGFRPPFSLPESLLQNLPLSEKVHQIIARTAMFVSKNGGQSEIILRVKQGDNPTFGFLMPHHHLHAYFRFLVDHPELLREENKTNSGLDQTSNVGGGGALSLLGSVYGSGEDEDGATEDEPKRNESDEAIAAVNVTVPNGSEQRESSLKVAGKDETVYKHSLASLKEKAPLIKRNQSISTVKVRYSSGTKKEGDALGSLCSAADESEASTLPRMSKVELPVVEPPSDMKRVVDKIVEFIQRNGKEFEAVLVEQDRKHGRFPFLLQSNLYYPYYLKVLHQAEESRLPGKGLASEKHDSTGLGMNKKNKISKESAIPYLESDIPNDSDRKVKFKMVLNKSKKNAQDELSKPTDPNNGVTVDAVAAAAILQAATRGIRNPDLGSITKMSLISNRQGPSGEGGQASSLGSLLSSWPQSSKQKLDQPGEPSVSVPVANVIAKSAAVVAASEADSSEASLSREQKLKAERLKRAKMFASMLKSKAAPLKTELHCQSVEPTDSGFSQSGAEIVNLMGKEREGSSVPYDVGTFDRNEKSERKDFADDIERRSKRKYRSRSTRDEEVVEDEEDEEEEEKDCKHSQRKRKSHRSSRNSRDRKRHSSSKDRCSWHRHKHDGIADNEHRHSRHQHKHESSSDDEHRHYRNQHKHDSSSDDKHRHGHSRHWHKRDRSTDDEHRHRSRSHKHGKRYHSEREVELEEGEIKSDQSKASGGDIVSREASVDVSKSHHSGEASVDLSKSCQDGRASSQPSNTDEVSDDLRAKIRAMLMATL